jgi:hypothetical protein
VAKPDLNKATQQDEFHVDLAKVLEAFVDADEVQEGDKWGFVDGGEHLVIVRRRTTITDHKALRRAAEEALKAEGTEETEE